MRTTKAQISLRIRFVSYLVTNPEDSFSREAAQLLVCWNKTEGCIMFGFERLYVQFKKSLRITKVNIILVGCMAAVSVYWSFHFYWQTFLACGPRQANLVFIAYASSEGSGEPAHPRSLARTFAARSYKQWVKQNLQTESQIPGPFEWLGMCS